MTTIFLIRHSEPLKSFDYINEEIPLSLNGEELARELSKNAELHNIDLIYSSEYKRAIFTARYIALENNLVLNITDKLNERRLGDINSVPKSFWLTQLYDEDAKATFGESRKEVCNRMLELINYILDNYKDKRVVLVSHGAAITFLLMNWCELVSASLETKSRHLTFNGKDVINGVMNCPDVFKLEFDGNELIDLKNVYYN